LRMDKPQRRNKFQCAGIDFRAGKTKTHRWAVRRTDA
jgi:hypothetical protein